MKKTLLFALLVLSSLTACFAQYSHTRGMFSMGIEGSLVTGSYDSYSMNNLFKNGRTGSINLDLPVYPNMYFTVAGGISMFKVTEEVIADFTRSPLFLYATSEFFEELKMGAKYYTVKGLFIEVQAGCVFRPSNLDEFMTKSGIAPAYSAGIGYLFPFGIELGARYEVWKLNGGVNQMDQLAVRLAYAIKFPRH